MFIESFCKLYLLSYQLYVLLATSQIMVYIQWSRNFTEIQQKLFENQLFNLREYFQNRSKTIKNCHWSFHLDSHNLLQCVFGPFLPYKPSLMIIYPSCYKSPLLQCVAYAPHCAWATKLPRSHTGHLESFVGKVTWIMPM